MTERHVAEYQSQGYTVIPVGSDVFKALYLKAKRDPTTFRPAENPNDESVEFEEVFAQFVERPGDWLPIFDSGRLQHTLVGGEKRAVERALQGVLQNTPYSHFGAKDPVIMRRLPSAEEQTIHRDWYDGAFGVLYLGVNEQPDSQQNYTLQIIKGSHRYAVPAYDPSRVETLEMQPMSLLIMDARMMHGGGKGGDVPMNYFHVYLNDTNGTRIRPRGVSIPLHVIVGTPTKYTEIDCNEYSDNIQLEKEEVDRCQCAGYGHRACTSQTRCANVACYFACTADNCSVEHKLGSEFDCGNRHPLPLIPRDHVVVGAAGRKGWGLYANEEFKRDEFVQEYIGEVIDNEECEKRLKIMYQHDEHFYIIKSSSSTLIDATHRGGPARFVNHSCAPNLRVEEWHIGGRVRLGLFANDNIPRGSELTFDYNLKTFGPKKKACLCGATNCRGSLSRSRSERNGDSNGDIGDRNGDCYEINDDDIKRDEQVHHETTRFDHRKSDNDLARVDGRQIDSTDPTPNAMRPRSFTKNTRSRRSRSKRHLQSRSKPLRARRRSQHIATDDLDTLDALNSPTTNTGDLQPMALDRVDIQISQTSRRSRSLSDSLDITLKHAINTISITTTPPTSTNTNIPTKSTKREDTINGMQSANDLTEDVHAENGVRTTISSKRNGSKKGSNSSKSAKSQSVRSSKSSKSSKYDPQTDLANFDHTANDWNRAWPERWQKVLLKYGRDSRQFGTMTQSALFLAMGEQFGDLLVAQFVRTMYRKLSSADSPDPSRFDRDANEHWERNLKRFLNRNAGRNVDGQRMKKLKQRKKQRKSGDSVLLYHRVDASAKVGYYCAVPDCLHHKVGDNRSMKFNHPLKVMAHCWYRHFLK